MAATPNIVLEYLPSVKFRYGQGGKHTRPFVKLIELCKSVGMDLEGMFGPDVRMKDIKICLENDLPAPTCGNCGKPTTFNTNRGGKLYACWCCMSCRDQDPAFGGHISKVKTALYSDPAWKAETEKKKVATTRANHGVDYPMQNVDIFTKQQNACFKKDENGLHGFEPHVWKHIAPLYSDLENGTEYMKRKSLAIAWTDDKGKSRRSYPDFFSEDLNTFFEVKSEYTLSLGKYKIGKCIERLGEMGYGYILIVSNPGKSITAECFNLDYIDD